MHSSCILGRKVFIFSGDYDDAIEFADVDELLQSSSKDAALKEFLIASSRDKPFEWDFVMYESLRNSYHTLMMPLDKDKVLILGAINGS